MALQTITDDNIHTGDYVLSEAAGTRSRDNIKIASGSGIVKPGRVLGKVTASGKFKPHDPAATDGSEVAAAVNYAQVDATATDVVTPAHTRDCEVKAGCLGYAPATDTAPEKDAVHAALAANGIVVR
jgi:hypothetical protein